MPKQRLPERVLTERLLVRHWEPDDVDDMARAISESIEHLRPWMPWIAEEPKDRDERLQQVEQWRSDWEQGGDAVYGIWQGGAVIGGTGLHSRGKTDSLEIGYWIHVDHIGQGYATEIARALTDAAFEVKGIDRVEIHHDAANVASRRIPKKLGYTIIAETDATGDAPADSGVEVQWAIARDRWLATP